ncbi:kinetochore protein NDC80 [Entomortierella parvispora]|uniref:Kinetochore protein NDC80 n=1 Tax=Entomortierella parvispora TaxID=205924 RepID=A0A9P3HJV7_9FUNG|nr:kinetochore protein NDC80 [Entomortierella parvispora]
MQGPPSNNFYSNNPAPGGMNTSGAAGSNNRWSVSSNFRQSVTGSSAHRNSMLNSGVMMSQRPSPMGQLNNEDHNMLNSSVMGPPMGTSRSSSASGFAPRQSFSGSGSRMTAQINSMNQRDNRPIKDKSYQRSMVNDLVNYLNQSGYQHNVTTKTLTQPTNKDFQEIFKYLYHKLEPDFDFQKKPEDEVPALLKTMRYPAADTITRTALYAVGTPHSWPNMLALMSWMVEVKAVIDKHRDMLDQLKSSNAQHRNRDIIPDLDMTQVSPDRALYYYLIQTYKGWMLYGLYNDPDLDENLSLSFQRRQEYAEDQARHLQDSIESLRLELETSLKEPSELEALQRDQEILEKDQQQFHKAIEYTEPRIEEVNKANEKLKSNMEAKRSKLEDSERAFEEIQEIVRSQTMTRAGLEAKIDERNKLRRKEESLRQHIRNLDNEQRSLDKRFQENEAKAEEVAKEYNDLAIRAGIVPISAKYAGGKDYELQLDLDSTLTGSGNIYTVDIKGAERAVSALRNQFTKEVNRVSSELAVMKEEYDQLEDQFDDESTDLRMIDREYFNLNKKYQEEKDAARSETLQRQSFVEAQEEAIQKMIQDTNYLVADAERLDSENAQLEKQLAQIVEQSNKKIKDILQQLSKAKQQVEQQVGVIQSMASKELEDTLHQKDQLLDIFDAESTIERRRANDPEATIVNFSRDLMFSQ